MKIFTRIGLSSEKWVFACYLCQGEAIQRIISPDWNEYPWCIANEHLLEYQARKTPGKLINWAMDKKKVIEENIKYERTHQCKKHQPSSFSLDTSSSLGSSMLYGQDVLGQ